MPQTQEAPAVTGAQDRRAEYAYTAGVQAFIYPNRPPPDVKRTGYPPPPANHAS